MRGAVRTLLRRWYVVVAMIGFAGVAAVLILDAPGVYMSQVNVVLLAPQSDRPANPLDDTSRALVDLAGITAKSVGASGTAEQPVSAGVSLVSQGITRGWSVRQPNSGGQWNYSFNLPVIDVQASGPSAEVVARERDAVVARIQADVSTRETAAGVRAQDRVRTMLSPAVPGVYYSEGDRRRALFAALLLTVLLTVVLVPAVDRLGARSTPIRA